MLSIDSLLNGVLLRDNNLERDSQQMAIGAESVSDCPRTRLFLSLTYHRPFLSSDCRCIAILKSKLLEIIQGFVTN